VLAHHERTRAVAEQDREAAVAYNRRDVEIEIEIARMCGCI
jgi:choline dehydrogenase-like flavoprotein